MTVADDLRRLADQVAHIERELRVTNRLALENGQLCDELAAARARIRHLERALHWFADEGHYSRTYQCGAGFVDAIGLVVARAALLDIDDGDADAVNAAWLARAESKGAA